MIPIWIATTKVHKISGNFTPLYQRYIRFISMERRKQEDLFLFLLPLQNRADASKNRLKTDLPVLKSRKQTAHPPVYLEECLLPATMGIERFAAV
jgi:hypothetical protein